MPQPPTSLETGPVGTPPSADFIWIPGTWIFRNGQFLWLAGQWAPVRRGWVWVPAHYVFTPAGYVFVDGFWDYELQDRGVLFAPVAFPGAFTGEVSLFTPSVVLNTDLLTDFLFVNSPCGCYCFGDFFGANCEEAGIFPWFAFHMSSLGFDPLFAFSSWAHHKDAGWHEKLIADFRSLRNDAKLPRLIRLATSWHVPAAQGAKPRSWRSPLDKLAARTGRSSLRFVKASAAERSQISRSVDNLREVASKRSEFEKKTPSAEGIKKDSASFADTKKIGPLPTPPLQPSRVSIKKERDDLKAAPEGIKKDSASLADTKKIGPLPTPPLQPSRVSIKKERDDLKAAPDTEPAPEKKRQAVADSARRSRRSRKENKSRRLSRLPKPSGIHLASRRRCARRRLSRVAPCRRPDSRKKSFRSTRPSVWQTPDTCLRHPTEGALSPRRGGAEDGGVKHGSPWPGLQLTTVVRFR